MDTPPRSFTSRMTQARTESGAFPVAAVIRMALWSVCYFLFYFAQQIAELLAPLLLILGIGWAILPHIIGAITTSLPNTDPQAHDVMNHVVGTIPHEISIGGHLLTPSSLIFDGILLMALAAIGATLSALAARNM